MAEAPKIVELAQVNVEEKKPEASSAPAPNSKTEKSAEEIKIKPYLYKNEPFWSNITYLFGKKIIDSGIAKPFGPEDLYPLDESWLFDNSFPEFEQKIYSQMKDLGRSFRVSFYRPFLGEFMHSLSMWLIGSIAGLFGPVFIRLFVTWMRNRGLPGHENDAYLGWVYGAIILVANVLKLMLKRRSMFISFITQYRVGQFLRGLVYNKFNRLSSEAIRNLDIGKISNTLSSDIWQIQLALRFSQVFIVTPVLFIAIVIYIWILFGALVLIIPGVFVLILTITVGINKFTSKFIQQKKGLADKRTKFVNEVITGIKNIKFQAWDEQAKKKINDIRGQEVRILRKYISLRILGIHLNDMGSSLAILAFYYFFNIVAGNPFDLGDSYLLISFVAQIYAPMKMMAMSFDMINNASISLGRIENVVRVPNTESVPDDDSLAKGTIRFSNYTGGWFSKVQTDYFKSNQDKLSTVAIKNIDLVVEPGKMYAVLGEVGSGKSSLLLATLHDLIVKEGSVKKHGSVAYITQNAFLLNATLKSNVVFHHKFDENWYKECLIRACLLDDIKQLPGGDLTEIGERGINLSGGQKQRVNIARALYANKDIYLVDDCLSALDAEVGKRVFYDVFKKCLKGKTILMVTHSTNILPDVDEIILMKNGEIVLKGPYSEIKNNQQYLDYYYQTLEESKKKPEKAQEFDFDMEVAAEQADPQALVVDPVQTQGIDELRLKQELAQLDEYFVKITEKRRKELEAKGALTKAEGRSVGIVSSKYLGVFIKAYLVPLFLTYFTSTALFTGLRIFADYWVGLWAKGYNNWSSNLFVSWDALINLGMFLMVLSISLVHSNGIMRASTTIHERMVSGVLRNAIEYFDTTPVGQIINKFTKDVEIMDMNLAHFITQFQFNFLTVMGSLILQMISVPYIIIFVILAILIFMRVSKKLLTVSSDIRRLSMIAASPILSNVSETLAGNLVIRTYEKFTNQKVLFVKNLEKVGQIELHERFMQSYIFQIIELVSAGLLCVIILLVILIKIYDVGVFSDPNVLALCINWSSISTEWVGMLLFSYQELNTGINCIERLHQTSIPTNPEPEYEKPLPPSENWPATGQIELRKANVRYRENLPLVLKQLDVLIKDKEKVGIVGRTGSGKSTIILALKRMLDIVPGDESFIKVDGVNITSMGLKYYRSAVVLIPQDPFLLSGTVRSNIDPDGKYKDSDIETVLKKTQIFDNIFDSLSRVANKDSKSKQTTMKAGEEDPLNPKDPEESRAASKLLNDAEKTKAVLQFEIKEGGSNISQGQRQLLCIARAIISNPRILLMDEATANIDTKTDQIIQKIIKTEFKESTVVTIAHRLNTIIQYDRVLVLSAGELLSQGSPLELLEKEGIFRDLVKELGEANFEKMRKFAADHTLDPVLE